MWWALAISPVRRADFTQLSPLLFSLGASGLQEEPVLAEREAPRQPWDEPAPAREPRLLVVTAWFEAGGAERTRIEAEVRRIARGATLAWAPVDDRDWQAEFQASVHPFRVGRLVIAPPWAAAPGALIIEPGLGFGTGDHPTTRQALAALETRVGPGTRGVLDVGCGSGILALAAAHLGATGVVGVDVEAAAIREAERHAALNQLDVAFSLDPVARLAGPSSVVVANLHAELIAVLAPDLRRLTGDLLILAGILVDRESVVAAALGWEPTVRHQDGEWVCWEVER